MIGRLMLMLVVVALAMPAVGDDPGERLQVAQRKSMQESAKERMTDDNYDSILGRHGNGPAVGTMAPDFELMPLKFYEFGIDEREITEETAELLYEPVRLSDFRGVKPVVLIFGSYT